MNDRHSWAGLIELFVVLLFVVGWGVLELVALRIDRRKAASEKSVTGHSEGQ